MEERQIFQIQNPKLGFIFSKLKNTAKEPTKIYELTWAEVYTKFAKYPVTPQREIAQLNYAQNPETGKNQFVISKFTTQNPNRPKTHEQLHQAMNRFQ